ncbi:MAG: MFS transporter [Acidiferrobacterales bacterium]
MTINSPVADKLPFSTVVRVFVPFALGYFLSYLYRAVNAVIAPNLADDIGLDAAGLGLLTSAYFLTFAVFQLPLGILLDRFGPRKTEAALLVFAALGALVFATADTLAGLTVGRGLIGLGVSACLMAAFKAFALWFPSGRLPLINGLQMAAGGLGALSATTPVEAALQITDWRGVFLVLAVVTFATAGAVLLAVPERQDGQSRTGFVEQARGVGRVFTSRVFWHIVPWTVMSQATFLAVYGLWAGPWLRDVAGLHRDAIANHLALIATAMIAGFILLGAAAERLSRHGVKPITVACTGMTVFMGVQAALIFQWTDAALMVWMLFGFFGTTGILPYAILSQSFPVQLAGRVITGLNVLVFLAAFAAQWGIGVLINFWPTTAVGGYAPEGYHAAFMVMLALQALGLIWYGISAIRLYRARP